ncbi:MAG: nucleotide sugar dehydrogenase [Pseudomonadota bacterium]
MAAFKTRLEARRLRVAIIGLGYVGLPLALGFHGLGLEVVGLDTDPAKIETLARGESYIRHIGAEDVRALQGERFTGSTDFSELADVDVIVICVPTPLTKHLEPDMTYVVSTCETVAASLRAGQLVVLESTTYPGTTRDLLAPLLAKGSGLEANRDFFVAYSPEREDPGNERFDHAAIPKVVGASTTAALEMAVALYSALVPQVIPVSSPETAEAVKLTENIFRAVNIAMVNELKGIYAAMGIDVWEVVDAAATKPFGFMPFYPGPGVGGHCIPIDPFYLTWKARAYGLPTRFIELAGQVNRERPAEVVEALAGALSTRQRKAMHGARVLLLGVAYKKNVDDIRESPSLTLIELMEARGAHVAFHDPCVPAIKETRDHGGLAGRASVALTPEALADYDAVLIATDHDDVDYALVVDHAALILDTRNACGARGLRGATILKA